MINAFYFFVSFHVLSINCTLNLHGKHRNPNVKILRQQGIQRIRDIFADLSIFSLNVDESKTTTIATICGAEEQGTSQC